MPPDAALEARRWFLKARNDLHAGQAVLAVDPPLIEDALFHAQQASEKAMKGFLVWHERPFRRIHDLREIGGAVLAIDASVESLLKRAVSLSPFAWVFRYPIEMGEPTLEEAREALALAREVYETILARLPEEVKP